MSKKRKINKKTKKILLLSLLGIGIIAVAFFGILQSFEGYEDFTEGNLDLSGTTRFLGYGYPDGYIITGEPGTNCGGRTNNNGVMMYHTCQIDYDSLDYSPYEICIDDKISRLGLLDLKLSGSKNCLIKESRYYCFGFLDFYDGENNKIGGYDGRMRKYSDGWRGTDQIDSTVRLDLSKGYKDILGESCFTIYTINPNKRTGTSGHATGKMDINFNMDSYKLYYDAVECEEDQQCSVNTQPEDICLEGDVYELTTQGTCNSNYTCENEIIKTLKETCEGECSNAECQEVIPTCQDDEELIDNVCVLIIPECEDDEELIDNVCVLIVPECADDEELINNVCIKLLECYQTSDCNECESCNLGSCEYIDGCGDECSATTDCDECEYCFDGECKIDRELTGCGITPPIEKEFPWKIVLSSVLIISIILAFMIILNKKNLKKKKR